MQSRVERRAPDRHLVAVRLLKRIALLALVLSVTLWAVPLLLVEAGLLGPDAAESVRVAGDSITLARKYGAAPSLPSLAAAEGELTKARQLAAAGDRRQARRAAERASAFAVEAQKQAIVEQAAARERARAVYDDLDRQVNELEKQYSATTPGLDKAAVDGLLSTMKATRAAAGSVFLAFEQEQYASVFAREGKARESIAHARAELQSARR